MDMVAIAVAHMRKSKMRVVLRFFPAFLARVGVWFLFGVFGFVFLAFLVGEAGKRGGRYGRSKRRGGWFRE